MAPVNFNKRKFWLVSLLLLMVLAAAWPVSERKPASPGADTGTAPTQAHAPAAAVNIAFAPLVASIASGKHITPMTDLFPQQTWTPAPPPPAAQATPVAPPLPFVYTGRYTEGNKVTIFLMEGNKMYRVQQGEIVKESYRVEKIEQASISLTYLPLGATQILPTGVLQP